MTKPTSVVRLPAAPVADQRLLKLLKDTGRIDPIAARAIERAMNDRALSMIDAVVENGVLSESEIAEAIAAELNLPLADLHASPCHESAMAVMDKSMAQHWGLAPVRVRGDILVVAMANPLDLEARAYLESSTQLRLEPMVATVSQILEAINGFKDEGAVQRRRSSLDVLLADVAPPPKVAVVSGAPTVPMSAAARAIAEQADQAPIVKMVSQILFEASNVHASDVHIEPGPNLVLVRFRIDGILEEHLEIPKWVQAPIVARIKVMAKLDITERRKPQDGHLSVRVQDNVLDLRVSSMPTTFGEKIVIRLLDPGNGPRRLDQVGLSQLDLETLRSVIKRPEGMILCTGPTGSGKTTTLYAIIQELLSPEINIVTIENPVEYELKGVSQIPINEKQGLTFAQVLRSVLRQDPDVILVGEIRDRETAETAFQAAQTGHLVLSTVHTNDSAATVTRLLDLGIEPQVMASSLLAVVAQRLVRKVCNQCAETTSADEEAQSKLGFLPDETLRRGRGCTACRGTGFSGRVGCYEVMRITKSIERLIDQKADEIAIRAVAVEEGMTLLAEDARSKVVAGTTTPSEVFRVIEIDTRAPACPSCKSPVESSFSMCPYCRSPLRLVCSGCGAALKKKWTSCPFCGVATVSAPGAARPLSEVSASNRDLGVFESPRILVVDDAEDILELVRLTLRKGLPEVSLETATTGEEALAKVEASRPHLIILDLMLPGLDGYEVCRRLRRDLKTALIPIIMLTALADPESRRLGNQAGTDDYLVKPFERSELIARIQRLLKRTYGWPADPVEGAIALNPQVVNA